MAETEHRDIVCSFCGSFCGKSEAVVDEHQNHYMCAGCVELAAFAFGKRRIQPFVNFYLGNGEAIIEKGIAVCRAVLDGRAGGSKPAFAKSLAEWEQERIELHNAKATGTLAKTQ